MMSIRSRNLPARCAAAITLAVAFFPATATAQVTPEEERRIATIQRNLQVVDAWLDGMAEAQRTGDCDAYNSFRWRLDRVGPTPGETNPVALDVHRQIQERFGRIKAGGCTPRAAAAQPVVPGPALAPLPQLRSRETDWDADIYQYFRDQTERLRQLRTAGQCEGPRGYTAGLEQMGTDLNSTLQSAIRAGVGEFRSARPVVAYFQNWREIVLVLDCTQAVTATAEAPPPRPAPADPSGATGQVPPPRPFPTFSPEVMARWERSIEAAELALAGAERARLAGQCIAFYDGLRRAEEHIDANIPPHLTMDVRERRQGMTLMPCPAPSLVRAPPIAGQPNPAAVPAAPQVVGTYRTDFGDMSLTATGGIYEAGTASLAFVRVDGATVEGIWTQDNAAERCTSGRFQGRFQGRFRFIFTATGFTGRYGRCDEALTRVWNGTRTTPAAAPAPRPSTGSAPIITRAPDPAPDRLTPPVPAPPPGPTYLEAHWASSGSTYEDALLDGEEVYIECPAAQPTRVNTSGRISYRQPGGDPMEYSVFGTNQVAYAFGSQVCAAAVHAGVIGFQGGRFKIFHVYVRGYEADSPRQVVGGFIELPGSTANRVQSRPLRQRRAEIFRIERAD